MADVCNRNCSFYGPYLNSKNFNKNQIVKGQDVIAYTYIGIGILGCLLNIIVLFTLLKFQLTKSNVFRMLLRNLALADFLSSIGVILVGAKTLIIIDVISNLKSLSDSLDEKILASLTNMCRASYVIFFITNFLSGLTITVMAVERYLVIIVRKFRGLYQNDLKPWKLYVLLAGIWATAIAGSIPYFISFEITDRVNNRCFFSIDTSMVSCIYNIILTISTTSVLCVAPSFVMVFCYFKIARYLFSHRRPDTEVNRRRNGQNFTADKQAGLISILIAIFFILSMTPFMAYLIFVSINYCNADEVIVYWINSKSYFWITAHEIAHYLFILPPIINPLCYSFSSTQFRRAINFSCKDKLKKTRMAINLSLPSFRRESRTLSTSF
ncbi:rhodopsin [Trichoplax sp. H2]|nr:rhodopsin [Trichoplax sp. H2]|eukprot:RDD38739.1 rhodopsin [Trichoplax sp. H2]